jgi:hypothetical protein
MSTQLLKVKELIDFRVQARLVAAKRPLPNSMKKVKYRTRTHRYAARPG